MSDMVQGEAGEFYSLIRGGLADDLGITTDTTDAELRAIADTEEMEAREQGQIVTGIYAYLRDLRDGIA